MDASLVLTGLPLQVFKALESCDAIAASPLGVIFRCGRSEVWRALLCHRAPDADRWRLTLLRAEGTRAVIEDGGDSWQVKPGLFDQLFGPIGPMESIWYWQGEGRCWCPGEDSGWQEMPADFDPVSAGSPGLLLPDLMERLEPATLDPALLQASVYPDLRREWFTTPDWDPALYAGAARAGMISVSWQPGLETWLLAQLQTEYAVLDWDRRRVPGRLRRQAARPHPILAASTLVLTRRLGPVASGIRERYAPECWLKLPYAELIQDLALDPQPGCQPLAVELRGPQGELWAGELGYTSGRVYTCLSGYVSPEAPTGVSWGIAQILASSQVFAENGYAFMNMGHTEQPYKLALGARILGRGEFLERWIPARDAAVTEKPAGWSPGLPFDQALPVCGLLGALG